MKAKHQWYSTDGHISHDLKRDKCVWESQGLGPSFLSLFSYDIAAVCAHTLRELDFEAGCPNLKKES